MKKLFIILSLLATNLVNAQGEEAISNQIGSNFTSEIKVKYEFVLKHRDGTDLPIKLVEFTKNGCIQTEQGTACLGGYTDKKSNNTRKQDPEHPVDTTEVIYLLYQKGNRINLDNFLHEANHAITIHYMSRAICETNWRYGECLEAIAYDTGDIYNQIKKQKNIKLIY